MLNKLRYALYRFKYVNAPRLKLYKPVDVTLELASDCTNRCGYCYQSDSKNLPFKRGLMDKNLAIEILNEAAELGVNSLKWNWRGEATMNPHFEEITSHAKSLARGMTFIDRVLNTNFNFDIGREDIFLGLCNQTKVKVSFDSFQKNIFERQRTGSKYEATLANIDKFYNYRFRDNILVVQSVRTTLNKDEDLEHEIKKRWPEAVVSIRDMVEGRVNRDISKLAIKKRDDSDRQTCLQAHARVIVGWNGKVSPCCPAFNESLIVGNANRQTIKEIWNSKTATNLREDLLNKSAFKKHDACKTCPSFESYKGYVAPRDS